MPDTYVALSAEDSRALRGVCDLPLVSAGELANFLGGGVFHRFAPPWVA